MIASLLLLFLPMSLEDNIAVLVKRNERNFDMTCATGGEESKFASSWISRDLRVTFPKSYPSEYLNLTKQVPLRSAENLQLPPVFDRRWEDFQVRVGTPNESTVVLNGFYDTFAIHFSLRFVRCVQLTIQNDNLIYYTLIVNNNRKFKFSQDQVICGDNGTYEDIVPWRHYTIFQDAGEYFVFEGLNDIVNMTLTRFNVGLLYIQSERVFQWKIQNYYLAEITSETVQLINDHSSDFVCIYIYSITENSLIVDTKSYEIPPNKWIEVVTPAAPTIKISTEYFAYFVAMTCSGMKRTRHVIVKEPNSYACQSMNSSVGVIHYNATLYDKVSRKNIREFADTLKCEDYTSNRYCERYTICESHYCYCASGFMGVMCNQNCPSDRYGFGCNSNCSEACRRRECDNRHGNCIECISGTWGLFCEALCGKGCKNNECDKSGNCSCRGGYIGEKCLNYAYLHEIPSVVSEYSSVKLNINTSEISQESHFEYCLQKQQPHQIQCQRFKEDNNKFVIEGLMPAQNYTVILVLCNGKVCNTDIKENPNITLSTICKMLEERDITSKGGVNSIVLTINKFNESIHCPLKFYKVKIDNRTVPLTRDTTIDVDKYKLYKLSISIEISQLHLQGEPIKLSLKARPEITDPGVPSCSLTGVDQNSVTFHWNLTNFNGPHVIFLLSLVKDESEIDTFVFKSQDNGTENTHKLTSLTPATEYRVQVRANNTLTGPWCKKKLVTSPVKPSSKDPILISECNPERCKIIIPPIQNLESNSYIYIVLIEENSKENSSFKPVMDEDKEIFEHLQLGNDSRIKWLAHKELLLKQNDSFEIDLTKNRMRAGIKSRAINENTKYEIRAIIVNQFQEQLTYSDPLIGQKIEEEGSNLYYLLFLLVPISLSVLVCVFRKEIRNLVKKSSLNVQRFRERETIALPENGSLLNRGPSKKAILLTKSTLSKYLYNLLQNEQVHILEEEFNNLQNFQLSRDVGTLDQYKNKNRYPNVIPFDATKVTLNTKEYYINASYVEGHQGSKTYIATQCPLSETQNDFWEMVMQEKVTTIVCLATLTEGKAKMIQYWPDEETTFYKDISVSLVEQKTMTDFIVRRFKVRRNNTEREVKQMYYTTWPDQGIPIFPLSFLEFLKYVRCNGSDEAPILVHCSAGVGRTGTYIVCDYYLRHKNHEINVPKTVESMRRCRQNLVANSQQYLFIFYILDEIVNGHDTNMSLKSLCSLDEAKVIEKCKVDLDYVNARSYKNALIYPKLTPTTYDPAKNRVPEIKPVGPSIIYLPRYPSSNEQSTYINAVTVNGLRTQNEFISTQLPLPQTVGDFWRLVDCKRIKCIFILQHDDSRDMSIPQFWPNHSEILDVVDFIRLENQQTLDEKNWVTYTLRLHNTKKEVSNVVKLVCFKSWKFSDCVPESIEAFYTYYKYTENFKSNSSKLLCCYDGALGCGLYLAFDMLYNKMINENIFNVCWAVQTIRSVREEFISRMEQIHFLYKLAMYFAKCHLTDANLYSNQVDSNVGNKTLYYQNIFTVCSD